MSSRIQRLQQLFPSEFTFVVTNPINIRYLCGYSGSNGVLRVTQSTATLYTDARYEIQSATECFDVEVVITRDLLKSALSHPSDVGVVFESAHLTHALLSRMQSLAPDRTFAPSAITVESLRVIKDASEIELIAQACKISTQALEILIPMVRVGMTEREISRMLERKMVDLGADEVAFETIVASGPNSAIPHHQPTGRALITGDFLKIDFGAKLRGYHSDCTRTFVVGPAQQWQQELYQAVAAAQAQARDLVKHGVSCEAVTNGASESLSASGYAEFFRHGLGHGVGLVIHEDPFLSATSSTTLMAGTVLTIEPGAYLANRGGVRVEDTIVVTESGYQNLTEYSYDLQEIG